ncbi:rhomboid family intramembrane serine protease [Mucilaginibacter lacusdianchii]|uniref:rhomboid family intramembrane serine protease n=1 Tax=Mucilaginibacter lacusdianchii TaxID=2684211 RepID=UPI00131AC18A|nr:rhomboid family intramembrane serine protease [Mucilaginibacter sp. JXJ CY 39]
MMTIRLLTNSLATMPVTLLIMLLVLINSCIAMLDPGFFLRCLLHPVTIWRQHQFYRWATADLVHNDVVHLLINEVLLFFIGGTLEKYLGTAVGAGSLRYLIIYLSSMLAGAVMATIINRNDFDYSATGASGSIVGCMFSYMLLQPEEIGFYVPWIGGINNLFSALILIAGLIVYQLRSKNPVLSQEVHFFGAVGGITATLVQFPQLIL